jgi:hypothetical protein
MRAYRLPDLTSNDEYSLVLSRREGSPDDRSTRDSKTGAMPAAFWPVGGGPYELTTTQQRPGDRDRTACSGLRLRASQNAGDECQVHLADDLRSCLGDVTEGAVAKHHIVARRGRLVANDAQCGQQPTPAVTCPRPSSDLTAVFGGNVDERLQRRIRSWHPRSRPGSRRPGRTDAAGSTLRARARSGCTASPDDNDDGSVVAFVRRLEKTLGKKLLQMEGGQPDRDSGLIGHLRAGERTAGGPDDEVRRPSCRIIEDAQLANRLVELVTHTPSNTTTLVLSAQDERRLDVGQTGRRQGRRRRSASSARS